MAYTFPVRTSLLILGLVLGGCATSPSQKSDASVNASSIDTIDDKPVTAAEFDAFEKSLTDRKDTITCAETTTGGFSEYEGTDAHGVRYRVRNETRKDQTLRTATRAQLSP